MSDKPTDAVANETDWLTPAQRTALNTLVAGVQQFGYASEYDTKVFLAAFRLECAREALVALSSHTHITHDERARLLDYIDAHYPAPAAPAGEQTRPAPTPDLEAVDGSYEAFKERVGWHYRNSPECQEARKHSFLRQWDVAFAMTMREYAAVVGAVPLPRTEFGGKGLTPEMVKVALDVADRDLSEGETFASVLAASLNRQMAASRPTQTAEG